MRFLHPEVFQGSFKKKHYFEGWYYKLTTADGARTLAFIPGFATGEKTADALAFIQMNGTPPFKAAFVPFPASEFWASEKETAASVGPNTFDLSGIRLNIKSDALTAIGRVDFSEPLLFPKTFFRRGAMGPFTFMPFMECRHGVASFRHRLAGSLLINKETVDFTGGTGYVEKDWGTSFPSAWVWLQTERFEGQEGAFMLSAARIPFMGMSFTGVLTFLLADGKYYPLCTYNGAKITALETDGGSVSLKLQSRAYTLEVSARGEGGGLLKAPGRGVMQRDILETLNGNLQMVLKTRGGETLFNGRSLHAALEICGDTNTLRPKK